MCHTSVHADQRLRPEPACHRVPPQPACSARGQERCFQGHIVSAAVCTPWSLACSCGGLQVAQCILNVLGHRGGKWRAAGISQQRRVGTQNSDTPRQLATSSSCHDILRSDPGHLGRADHAGCPCSPCGEGASGGLLASCSSTVLDSRCLTPISWIELKLSGRHCSRTTRATAGSLACS